MAFIYVRSLISRRPVTVEPGASVCDAARLMKSHGIGSLVIVDSEGRPIGIVTERDLAYKVVGSCDCNRRVEDVMTRNPVTVREDFSIAEAARLMIDLGVRHLPVVDSKGRLVGVVSLRDLARAIWGMHETAPTTP